MSKTLFHYTPVFHAVMILRSGVIRRSSGKIPPYVWLSSNQTDEPTAARFPPQELVGYQGDELYLRGGRARFVFDEYDAIPWQDLPLDRSVRDNLEHKGKAKGGRSEEWFGIETDVPSASLPLEIEIEMGWRRMAQDKLKRRYKVWRP